MLGNTVARHGGPGRVAWIFATLLAALVLCGYLRTGLLLDDSFLLARASHRFGLEALDYALRTADHRIRLWVHPEPVAFEFFRPLSMLSLWIERRIWGPNIWGYHASNLVLHLANAWMLSRLAARCGLGEARALLGALAWALSIQVIPAAGWISGRTEVLWGTCALLSVHTLVRWRDGGGHAWFVASFVAATLAACAKESGLVAPLLALLVVRRAGSPPAASSATVVTPERVVLILLPPVVVMGVRLATIGMRLPPEPYLDVPHGFTSALWTAAKPGLYLGAGYLSLPLSHWGPLEWIHDHPWSLALLLPSALACTVALGRVVGRASLVLWLGWFVVALLPVMPIRPTSLYLYVPMMGLTMLIAAALEQRRNAAFAAWLVVTLIVGAGSHLFVQGFIARVWQRTETEVATVERWVRDRGATRLLTIDTPVWHYALPAAIELDSPDLRFETWFVNFKPRLDSVAASAVRWRTPLSLVITAPAGGFLQSTYERFLAFGGVPSDRGPTVEGPVDITIEGPRISPERLVVTFRDAAARDSTLIVRFGHDALRMVEPPPGVARPLAGAGVPSRETTAPGPTR